MKRSIATVMVAAALFAVTVIPTAVRAQTVQQLQVQLNTANAQRQQARAQSAQTQQLQNQLNAANAQLQQLRAQLTQEQTKLAPLTAENQKLKADLTQQAGKLAPLQNTQADTTAADNDRLQAQQQLDDVNKNSDSRFAQINQLQATVDDLTAKLSALQPTTQHPQAVR